MVINNQVVDRLINDNSNLVRLKIGTLIIIILISYNIWMLSASIGIISMILLLIVAYIRSFKLNDQYIDVDFNVNRFSNKSYFILAVALILLEIFVLLTNNTNFKVIPLVALCLSDLLLILYTFILWFKLDIIKES